MGTPAEGSAPGVWRGVGLSHWTELDHHRGVVRFQNPDGICHSVPTVVVATEICVTALGSQTALAEWLGVARHQPGRWLAGSMQPSQASRRLVIDLAYVISRARQLWQFDSALRAWLSGSEPLLDGAAPLDVVRFGHPTAVVDAIDAHLAVSYA